MDDTAWLSCTRGQALQSHACSSSYLCHLTNADELTERHHASIKHKRELYQISSRRACLSLELKIVEGEAPAVAVAAIAAVPGQPHAAAMQTAKIAGEDWTTEKYCVG